MNLAMKTYKYTDNLDGIPENWPSEIIELNESTTLPEGDGWVLMTEEEYQSYLTEHQAEYDTWKASFNSEALPQNYKIDEYTQSGRLLKISWYAQKDENDNFSGLAKEIIYEYDDTIVLSVTEIVYDGNGKEISNTKSSFYTLENKVITIKE